MLEIFQGYIKVMGEEKQARVQKIHTEDTVKRIQECRNLDDLKTALMHREGDGLSILVSLVAMGDIKVIEAIVNKGAFKYLNLNDQAFITNDKSIVELCAEAMSNPKLSDEGRDRYNRVYQILLYGGINTLLQELIYNTEKKGGIAAEVTTGWFSTVTTALSSAYNVLPNFGGGNAVGYLKDYVSNLGNDATSYAWDALADKVGEDNLERFNQAMNGAMHGGANLTGAMLNSAWDMMPLLDTRIKEPTNRGQILIAGGDRAEQRLAILTKALPTCSEASMHLSLLLLSKVDQEQLNKDYADEEFLIAVIKGAYVNKDHKAVISLLDDIFAKTNMPSKDRAYMVCEIVGEALAINNRQLVDELLLYYKAKNRAVGDYVFLNEVNSNFGLKIAFNTYLKQHNDRVQELIKEAKQQPDLATTMFVNELDLSRQALAYYRDEHIGTLLHVFVKNARADQVAKMVRYGVDINAKDANGHTALYYAATDGEHSKDQEFLVGIIENIVYGEVYDHFKDLCHNFGAKTEGTYAKSFGAIFKEASGASFRRITSEQANLAEDKESVLAMMKWLPAENLNFVMFYLVKRWPHKVVEWQEELRGAVKGRSEFLELTVLEKAWKAAGYEGEPKTIEGSMEAHLKVAIANNKFFVEEEVAKYLSQPGYLPMKLRELNKDKNNESGFPGFYKVVQACKDGDIVKDEALKRYETLVDTYYQMGSRTAFKRVIGDLLTHGSTTKEVFIPKQKDIKEMLCTLAEQMYGEGDSTEFKKAITSINLDGKVTLHEKGKAIVEGLKAIGYQICIFAENAKHIYTEQPYNINPKSLDLTRKKGKYNAPGIKAQQTPQPVVQQTNNGTPKSAATNGHVAKPNSDGKAAAVSVDEQARKLQGLLKKGKPEYKSVEISYSKSFGNAQLNAAKEYGEAASLAAFMQANNYARFSKREQMIGFVKDLYESVYKDETLDLTKVTLNAVIEECLSVASKKAAEIPEDESKKQESSLGATLAGLLGYAAGTGLSAYAIYQVSGALSPKLMPRVMPSVPEKVLGFIAELPVGVKQYGPMVLSVVGGAISAWNPRVAGVPDAMPGILFLGSAVTFLVLGFTDKVEIKPAIVTIATSMFAGVINHWVKTVGEKDGGVTTPCK
jgi:hypothetical protein